MDAMVAGFEIDLVWLLQAVMHERAFTATTTFLFPFIFFELFTSAGVPCGTLI